MIFILQMRETEARLPSQSTRMEPEVTPGWSVLKALQLRRCLHPAPDRAMWVTIPRG